jgi:uncharacterized protein YkwD
MPLPRSFVITACAVMLACASDAPTPSGPGTQNPPVGSPAPPSLDTEVAEFVGLVNEHRQSVGCGDLAWHTGAGDVADAHSADMSARDFFSHTNPDGESPFDRLADAGITYRAAGENIALTGGGPSGVLSLWLGSPGHRANIERCGYTHHGVGLVDNLWTHLFLEDPS